MSLIIAKCIIASEEQVLVSRSTTSLPCCESQAKVRSTTQPRRQSRGSMPEGPGAGRPRRAPGQQVRACDAARALDDLEPQALACRGAAGDLALIAGIGEQKPQPGEALSDPGAGQPQAVPVLGAGRVNHHPPRHG